MGFGKLSRSALRLFLPGGPAHEKPSPLFMPGSLRHPSAWLRIVGALAAAFVFLSVGVGIGWFSFGRPAKTVEVFPAPTIVEAAADLLNPVRENAYVSRLLVDKFSVYIAETKLTRPWKSVKLRYKLALSAFEVRGSAIVTDKLKSVRDLKCVAQSGALDIGPTSLQEGDTIRVLIAIKPPASPTALLPGPDDYAAFFVQEILP